MKKTIKMVGICGSPLANGNTAKLIKKVLEGAESFGAETEFISLGNKKLSFCRACYMCLKKGQCIINDDLNEIRSIMIECDGAVIGSPTDSKEITGQMKTFFDRMWFDIHRETFLGKYCVYVNTHMAIVGHSAKSLRDLCLALGYSVVGGVVSNNLAKFSGNINKDTTSMEKAFEMGVKLVDAIQRQKKYILQETIRKFFIRPVFRKVDRFISEKGG